MLLKSVSRRFVGYTTFAVGVLFSAPILFLARPLTVDFFPLGITLGCSAFILSHFLIRMVLSYLGIPVRRRSVEQFQAAYRDEKESVADLPFQIRYNQSATRIATGIICLLGLGIILIGFSIFGLVIFVIGLITARYQQPKICEITDRGIRAPGSWGCLRFVPWEELVHYEIVHDDENARGDYFVLRDREGCCRFNASSWITDVSPADRVRIFRALMLRFPGKPTVNRNAEPALLQAASSAVWDRELDG